MNKDKNNMNAYPNAIQVASQDFDVQIQAINNKEKEETIKNTRITTSQQVDNILNIYKNTGEKRVFLTFDDGPSKTVTPLILDLLKKENIKATFFLLGSRVEYNPDLVKRAYDEGHYIANHGYSHQYSSIYSSIDSILDEYNKTEQCIQKALGDSNYHSNLFRYPGGSNGGKYNKLKQEAKEVLKQNQIAYLDWNALSNDAAGAKTKEELINNIKSTVGGKSSVVILMHDASDKILTYETLPDVISFLREQGYKFETIYDII
ncbi:MAG TPA: polysaccharide deacetylase [Clostridiaceae bacterium]|nr:polysaccharide deacetylase [Clostridiaceae bacterium]